uniref:Uncharacterized protein n=1 Tax=Cucumis melo TaxID=3656 RepID=A0A9I9CCE2_CUCME
LTARLGLTCGSWLGSVFGLTRLAARLKSAYGSARLDVSLRLGSARLVARGSARICLWLAARLEAGLGSGQLGTGATTNIGLRRSTT